MPPKKEVQFKGKVLFLHGYCQSAWQFYTKTSAIRKKLLKMNFKPVYLNGPIRLSPADLPSEDLLAKFNTVTTGDEEVNYRAWWHKRSYTDDSVDASETVNCFRNYIEKGEIIPENGSEPQVEPENERQLPIVGLLGFSQGGAAAGLLAHKFNELFNVQTLKFVISIAGFMIHVSDTVNPQYKDYYVKDGGANEQYRILHLVGELDTVLDEKKLMSLYEHTKAQSDLLKHPGGHFVPNNKPIVDSIMNWVEKAYEGGVQNSEEEKESDQTKKEDMNSLMNMMDNLGKA